MTKIALYQFHGHSGGSPERTSENSPTFQGWVFPSLSSPVPSGTKENEKFPHEERGNISNPHFLPPSPGLDHWKSGNARAEVRGYVQSSFHKIFTDMTVEKILHFTATCINRVEIQLESEGCEKRNLFRASSFVISLHFPALH